VDSDYERIREAIAYIEENAVEQPSLDDVAAHVGLSPYHFQRLFQRWAGVSPKRFLQHVTAERAKELLRESESVLDTAFAVGLSGSGRLHDLLVTTEAMTPGEYGAAGSGVEIRYGIHDTPFGTCVIGLTDRGICFLRFADPAGIDAIIDQTSREWHGASLERDDTRTQVIAETIFDLAEGGQTPLSVHLRGTNFQLEVWEGLLRVPEGAVISYGDLAARLGMPTSTRAVASAVGANPVAYLIPCHRVLRSSGALGGYRWGTERKLVMLEREMVAGGTP
jgi:AraC family transcriptional regulator of adaptative response/methylated-DNA-[protein]-cysteine methyltransferase